MVDEDEPGWEHPIELRDLRDPEKDKKKDTRHMGTRPSVLSEVAKHRKFDDKMKFVADLVKKQGPKAKITIVFVSRAASTGPRHAATSRFRHYEIWDAWA